MEGLDLFPGAGATPAKTPASASELRSAGAGAPLPGMSDIRITPQSLGLGLDLLPEVEMEGGPATTSGGTFGALGCVGAWSWAGRSVGLLGLSWVQRGPLQARLGGRPA